MGPTTLVPIQKRSSSVSCLCLRRTQDLDLQGTSSVGLHAAARFARAYADRSSEMNCTIRGPSGSDEGPAVT